MDQQIIIGNKGSGKTTEIIKLSAENRRYILVGDKIEADNLIKLATKLGLVIPYPVTIQEVGSGKLKGTSIRRDGLYVDNALDLLENIIAVPIAGVSVGMNITQKDLNEIAKRKGIAASQVASNIERLTQQGKTTEEIENTVNTMKGGRYT